MKYRTLSRSSSHRQALLRNLVTSLFKNEAIKTTWHKAKEAQRLAEQLVTLAKRNTEVSRRKAYSIFYVCIVAMSSWISTYMNQEPHILTQKLFGPIRERYATRPGGYTRVLRIEPLKEDQAPSAILELIDGPKDMRFAMTARTLANVREKGLEVNDITRGNIEKVTRYRKDGMKGLEDMAKKMSQAPDWDKRGDVAPLKKTEVYPSLARSR